MSLRSIEPGMKLAVSISAEAEDDYLTFLKQMGIDWVVLWTTVPRAGAAYYLQAKGRFANAGLRVYGFGNGNLHNQDAIVLELENRDAKIEDYKHHLRALGCAGRHFTLTFTKEPGSGKFQRSTTLSKLERVEKT